MERPDPAVLCAHPVRHPLAGSGAMSESPRGHWAALRGGLESCVLWDIWDAFLGVGVCRPQWTDKMTPQGCLWAVFLLHLPHPSCPWRRSGLQQRGGPFTARLPARLGGSGLVSSC